MEKSLISKHCAPCEGGVHPLQGLGLQKYMKQLPFPWEQMGNGRKIHKVFVLKDFKTAVAFVNKIADLAELEGHHPDLCIFYNNVDITLWTHAIGGLSENDFIMAAKIEKIVQGT